MTYPTNANQSDFLAPLSLEVGQRRKENMYMDLTASEIASYI